MSVENNTKNITRLHDAIKAERKKTEQHATDIAELQATVATLARLLQEQEQKMLILGVANNFDSGPTA